MGRVIYPLNTQSQFMIENLKVYNLTAVIFFFRR